MGARYESRCALNLTRRETEEETRQTKRRDSEREETEEDRR